MENYRGWTALLGWIVFGVLLFIQWKDFHLFRTFVDSWNYKNSWNDTIVDGMCEFKTKSRYRKVTIVRACRNLTTRMERFDLELESIRKQLRAAENTSSLNGIIPDMSFETIWEQSDDLFQKLSNYPQVSIIALEWLKNVGRGNEEWNSLEDYSNLLIQKYYPLTGSELFCSWIEAREKTAARYDVIYNRTCNSDPRRAVEAGSLAPLTLNAKPPRRGNFWVNESFPNHFYQPPPYLNYLFVITSALVSKVGEIFSANLRLIPYACIAHGNHLPSPTQEDVNNFPLFTEIFVITQFWGQSVFHRMAEIVPRLAFHLDFLKRNTHIRIASPEEPHGRLGDIFRALGLDEGRIITGWLRAKIVYMPKSTMCGFVNIPELRIISRHFREYISKNFPFQDRNRVVLIRRSGSRRFTEQHEIEKVVESAAIDFNLSFAMFVDNPTPSFNDTMRLFKSAVMVVAPHGAGLSNILFSDPGTDVIEGVCNLPHLNLCFQRMAHGLGHRWHGIPSRGGCERVVDVSASVIRNIVRDYLAIHTRLDN